MHRSALRWTLVLLAALMLPAVLTAQTPQTIVLDGVNDFDPSNLLDADGGDTEHAPIDLGDVYVTNDAVNLFVGLEHDQTSWTMVQIGIAIDVGTADGGTTDPWGRELEWSLAANKPDFMFYVNLDNNWQDGLMWDGAAWVSLGAGPGAQGWVAGTNSFKELAILLGTLGVSAGDPLNVEVWITQDGVAKGPLDAAANDASQLSTPGGTVWETPAPIPMFDYLAYSVQNAADNDPPQVTQALHLVDSQVRVTFNEPVDPVTGGVAGNYTVSGATVTGASVAGNVATLALAADIGASPTLYTVTVANVQDLAGNVIGAGNQACFMVKTVVFRGRMSFFLSGQTEPFGGFTVEGSPGPLTWSLCDGMDGVDTGGGVYEVSADFCVPGDCGAGTAQTTLEYKWVYDCGTYEPLPSNRTHVLSLDGTAVDTLDVWWNDQDPTQFTLHDIDVEFFVDLNVYGVLPGDTLSINGSAPPLNWNVPSETELVDDGTGNDAAAGDGIYSGLVTFPAGSEKNVTYKFLLDQVYECATQGDRTVFLNDELFDVVGGALGPLTLPVVHYDRCTTTWRGVDVVFRVDVNGHAQPGDLVAVNGTPSNSETPSFSWDIPSLNPMADDGVAPDAAAGDGIYAVTVTFADSSQIFTEYKYLVNGAYECADMGNRGFSVDADNFDAAGNPQILPVDDLHHCVDTAVDTPARLAVADLRNAPNPFNPSTEIRFTVHRAGRGSLQVFNLKGEVVRTLREGHFETGAYALQWDGRADDGTRAATGAYFYRMELNGESSVRKMMLVK